MSSEEWVGLWRWEGCGPTFQTGLGRAETQPGPALTASCLQSLRLWARIHLHLPRILTLTAGWMPLP